MKTRHIIAAIILLLGTFLSWIIYTAFLEDWEVPLNNYGMPVPWPVVAWIQFWVVVLSWVIAKRKKSNRVPSPFND